MIIPPKPDFAARVRSSYERQVLMTTLGARLDSITPGEVTITLPFRHDLTQQHGFLHAGVVAAIADSACGYAAFTLMDADSGVLSVEFKVNLLAPAAGESFRAIGRVVRAGRTITVCNGEVVALRNGEATTVALIQATMMQVRDRPAVKD